MSAVPSKPKLIKVSEKINRSISLHHNLKNPFLYFKSSMKSSIKYKVPIRAKINSVELGTYDIPMNWIFTAIPPSPYEKMAKILGITNNCKDTTEKDTNSIGTQKVLCTKIAEALKNNEKPRSLFTLRNSNKLGQLNHLYVVKSEIIPSLKSSLTIDNTNTDAQAKISVPKLKIESIPPAPAKHSGTLTCFTNHRITKKLLIKEETISLCKEKLKWYDRRPKIIINNYYKNNFIDNIKMFARKNPSSLPAKYITNISKLPMKYKDGAVETANNKINSYKIKNYKENKY